jgi:hypothetical protein
VPALIESWRERTCSERSISIQQVTVPGYSLTEYSFTGNSLITNFMRLYFSCSKLKFLNSLTENIVFTFVSLTATTVSFSNHVE